MSAPQGYMQVSVQIVGPNDKLVVHNEDEDDTEEDRERDEIRARMGNPPGACRRLCRSFAMHFPNLIRGARITTK